MIRKLLLWFLKDDIIELADARANLIVGVSYTPKFKEETFEFSEYIESAWLEKNGRRILLKNIDVYEERDGEWQRQERD